MVKCPKCNFEQPPDQYCANCGVNMETYKPAAPPFWKKLAFNWMFQLGVLVFIIIAVVFYDGGKDHSNSSNQEVNTAYIDRQQTQQPKYSPEEPTEDATPSVASDKSNLLKQRLARRQKRADRYKQASSIAKVDSKPPDEPNTLQVPKPNGIRVSFYRINRRAFAEMQRANPESFTYSGYMAGGILDAKKIKEVMQGTDMEPLSANRFKEFNVNRPITVFKGTRNEQGANVGLNFLLTPDLQNGNTAQIKVEGWHALKPEEGEIPLFAGDMTLAPSKVAFFTNFIPRDLNFSEGERDLFDSDRVLRVMNAPEFQEERVDLIMFIELTQ